MLQTAFGSSCMNRASVFEWHKRFKEVRESVREDETCGRSKKVRTAELIGQIKNSMDKDSTGMIYMHWVTTALTVNKEYYVEFLREFRKRFCRKRPVLFKSGQ